MTTAGVAALVLTASPALAHFCFKEFNSTAAMNAAQSNAWITAEDWLAFLPEVAGDLPPACADAIEAFLIEDVQSDSINRLYMLPGLLAGGTLNNGKGNTPEKVGYLLALPGCEGVLES
jgi:hypothetical protein